MIFRRNKSAKRNVALGLDLGNSQIKAAVVSREGEKFELVEYAVRSLPADASTGFRHPQFIAELQQLVSELRTADRHAYVTLSCASAMVCQAEFPPMPLAEIKSALKLNSARYLRRDFSSYYLDAVPVQGYEINPQSKDTSKAKILVGGAQREDVDACREALVAAKIKPATIELAAVSVINSFHLAHAELEQEVVVLVDCGARTTSINFIQGGVPLITRIMHFGGAQLSEYVGQVLMLNPREAEEEKLKMSEPVKELVRQAISPIAREVRSSIDFFERQHDRRVRQIYVCGGSACSADVLGFLGEAVGMKVECWNPVTALDVSGFNGETPRVTALGPSLAAAVGVVMGRLAAGNGR